MAAECTRELILYLGAIVGLRVGVAWYIVIVAVAELEQELVWRSSAKMFFRDRQLVLPFGTLSTP
jgi:hypothetical protein